MGVKSLVNVDVLIHCQSGHAGTVSWQGMLTKKADAPSAGAIYNAVRGVKGQLHEPSASSLRTPHSSICRKSTAYAFPFLGGDPLTRQALKRTYVDLLGIVNTMLNKIEVRTYGEV